MTKQLLFVFFTAAFVIAGSMASSQALAQDSMDDIENLFSKDEEAPVAPAPAATPAPASPASPEKKTGEPIRDVTDLGKLQPFSDIAVISKRYLPKSQRFELFLAPTMILNDAFFLNYGGTGRLAYYFRERYGIEVLGTFLSVTERSVTQKLAERRVRTSSFVTPQVFYGVDFKWTPIYGKMSWINKKITPFDLYFSGGAGLTGTNQATSDPTLHLGTGQIFALSKNSAFRWDFSWNMYVSKTKEDTAGSLYHNIFISMGWSFFFPEASYR